MKNRIRRAFDDVRADEALLSKTAAYLCDARTKRENQRSRIQPLHLVGVLAAMMVLVVGILGYRGFYYSATAYVSIDVNPSMELALNRKDQVISATAYNADGDALLRKVDTKGKPYDEVVAQLLDEMGSQGYLTSGALVTMTVQTADGIKEKVLCDALMQSASSQINADRSMAEVEVFPVTQEVRETAHGCHMSAAKYLAIQELMEVDETATLEAYSGSTIRQIRQRTQTCREEHGNGSQSRGNGHGKSNSQNGQDDVQGSERGRGNHDSAHGHLGNRGVRLDVAHQRKADFTILTPFAGEGDALLTSCF